MRNPKGPIVSLFLHLAVLLLLALFNGRALLQSPEPIVPRASRILLIAPRLASPAPDRPAGGANQGFLPTRRGTPPPKAARVFIPPVVKPNPKLPLPAGLDFDPPVATLAALTGDPYGKLNSNSLGTGGVNGIGNSGAGSGIGDHVGGRGIDGGGVGHRITAPQLIYKVEPEFSEEARKAKYQGTVVLSIEVDTTGRPSSFVVVSSPGLGLDQKAIEAVAKWLFRPAFRDGKPVATTARIEVNFHLM